MNQTEKNRAKRDRKRNREIALQVEEMAKSYGQDLLNDMDQETREQLQSLPHPKCPNWQEASAYSYIEWMCGKGWHKKAKAVIAELTTN